MLDPALSLDAEMTVAAAIAHLDSNPRFDQVAIRLQNKDSNLWFALTSARLRWLLKDIEPEETLRKALELDPAQASPTFEGALQDLPHSFAGAILAEGVAVAVSHQPEAGVFESVRSFDPVMFPAPAPAIPRSVYPAPPTLADNSVTIVPVFYATDRDVTGKSGPSHLFGFGRGPLQFGRIEVSIPPQHERGKIEAPKLWKFEFSANPSKHLMLRSAVTLDRMAFLTSLEQESTHQALVFVHGYNVSFDAAVLRTAQIAHDLRFEGAPILYSWPSSGALLRYTEDENNAHWTETHFEEFLRLLLNDSALESVHVIAHSMGNRVVVETLRNLAADIDTSNLSQLILAAPDIDADTFEKISAMFDGKAKQVTLYASSRDLALRMSKLVHGYQRAGDTEPDVLLVKPVVTVDASHVDTNLLGHSYIGDGTSILADVDHLIRTGATPDQRRFFLNPVDRNGQRYWVFVP
jgi:esterase/lipase superfamily enzyme